MTTLDIILKPGDRVITNQDITYNDLFGTNDPILGAVIQYPKRTGFEVLKIGHNLTSIFDMFCVDDSGQRTWLLSDWLDPSPAPTETALSIIRVGAQSKPASVAGAIAGTLREHHHATVQAIGAGAVNQAVKALIIAGDYLVEDGLVLMSTPSFVEVEITGAERTAIRFEVTATEAE